MSEPPDELAPDGCEVRFLARTDRASMAEFRLPAGATSRAVTHRTVDELWFTASGTGQVWRSIDDEERMEPLTAGVSIAILSGTSFQFRCTGNEPLRIIGVTTPPWPGEDEAVPVNGPWKATL